MSDRQPLLPKTQPKPSPQEVSKKREIRAKLRTYEIILALSNGYFPTTKQFSGHLHWLLRSGILEPRNRRLSVRGRNAIRDLRAWIEAVAEEAEYKNGGNEVQQFVWELTQADVDVRTMLTLDAPDVPVSKGGVKRDSKKALKQLRTLGDLIYSNSEFRKLLTDANILFRDMFADAASKAADIASDTAHQAAQTAESQRPSQEELNNIDSPANGRQDKDKQPPSTDEVKDQADKAGKQAKQKGKEVKKSAQKKGKQSRDEIQEYLNQKFPKQRQDAVINRLKKLVTDIQKDPDYTDAINFLLDLLSKYTQKAKEAIQNASDEAQQADPNTHLEKAMDLGQQIITNYAGGHDLSGITNALRSLLQEIENDDTLKDYFHDVNRFIQRALKEEGFVMTDKADHEAHDLYDRGRELTTNNDKYKEAVEQVGDEFQALFDAISSDRGNRRVLLAGKKVFDDFTTEDGRFDVWRDFVDVVIPKAVSLVRYIPIPRIEYQDADIDLVIENLVFESDNFLPSKIRIDTNSHAEFTSAYTFESEYSNTTTIRVEEFRIRAKDISYAFGKKTGFLQFEDKGLLDVYMDKSGVSVEIKLTANLSTSNDDNFFQVDKVDVKINHFSYNLQQSEHNIFAFILYPFLKPIIRVQLQHLLEREIKSQFESMDGYFRDLRARVKVVKGLGPEAWVRAFFQGSTQTRGKGGQFAINVGGESVLRGFRGPMGEGMVRAERRAEEGHGWKNDIFDPQK